MATDLTALDARVIVTVRSTAARIAGMTTPEDSLSKVLTQAFSYGSGDDQCNQMWHDSRTLSNATSEDLDLAGVLTNGFGQTVNFSKIKTIFIHNNGPFDVPLEIGGAVATQFLGPLKTATDIVIIPNKGCMLFTNPIDGWTVTGGSLDLLKINNTGGSEAQYDIILFGLSA